MMPKGIYTRTEAHKQKLRESHVGYVRTEEHIAAFNNRIKAYRVPFKSGDKNPSWRGENVGYSGVHDWVKKNYGSPQKCVVCGTESAKVFDWANISEKYLRDISDWKRLCRPCHFDFDRKKTMPTKNNMGVSP